MPQPLLAPQILYFIDMGKLTLLSFLRHGAELPKGSEEDFCRTGASIHPNATSLMLEPPKDAQSLERDCRSAGAAQRNFCHSRQQAGSIGSPAKMPVWKHTKQRQLKKKSQRHAYACMSIILLASLRHGGMPPMTGVLEWKDTGCIGRTGMGVKKRMLPSLSVTAWSAGRSAMERKRS